MKVDKLFPASIIASLFTTMGSFLLLFPLLYSAFSARNLFFNKSYLIYVWFIIFIFSSYSLSNPASLDYGFFSFLITLLFVPLIFSAFGAREPFIRNKQLITLLLISLLILYSLYLFDISSKSYRFSGFSYNPNQLALILLVLLYMVLLSNLSLFIRSLFFVSLVGISFPVASDALNFSLLYISFMLLLGNFRFLIFILFFFSLLFYFDEIITFLLKFDEGGHRISLIADTFSVYTLFGQGPDFFSGVMGNLEVHNLFADWYLQFGLVGLILLLSFLTYIYIKLFNYKTNQVLFEALILISMFHYYARNPFFWICLAIVFSPVIKKMSIKL